MPIRIFVLSLFLAVLTACHTSKKTNSRSSAETIQLDTIQVLANQPKEIYRGSNPRSNDIIHTKLEVNFDWTNCRMRGKATIQVKPYFYPTNMLYLNARGMDINSLEVFDVPKTDESMGNASPGKMSKWNKLPSASYKYENDSLKINLGRTFTARENYFVVIDYIAKPNELKTKGGSTAITDDKGLYFVNPTGENLYKMPQIWTQGETQSGSVWFPTIDSPNERMTQEIIITVEERFTTLSNGALVSSTKDAGGTRTDHWKLDEPHAPYLAMMAVGEYKKVLGEPWNGKEISYYVDRLYENEAPMIFGDTKEMIEFFSNKLGVPYAWPKYAQVVARDYVSGAMENTSATLHGDFVYQTAREMIDSKKANSVICHELFHQWFGDLVTCESWSNLPLNESFATYSEYLWDEYKSGRDEADHHRWNSKQGYFHSDKEQEVIRFHYNDKEDMFDVFSYNKGGLILHMLRKAVGDEAFFASLKNYLETNRFKSAEIHNLRLAFEETTGKDMNWFFDQWFMKKGRPKLKVAYKYNAADNTIVLTVEQNQDLKKVPLYKLPLEVDVYTGGKAERKHIEISDQKQTFTLTTAGAPQLVNFDAERQLVCDLDYTKTKEEYVFQYKNAPLYEDRLEALRELEPYIFELNVFNLFMEAAQKDKHFAIRNHAISKLDKAQPEKLPEIKTALTSIYNLDAKTWTRAKALNALNRKFLNDADILELNKSALQEASYAICGEAIDGIAKIDPKLALQRVKAFENEGGKDVLFPVANLYANHGGDEQIQFFHKALRYMNGFETMSFCNAYVKTAKRCNESASAVSTAMDLEMIGKGSNKYIKYAVTKGIKDILTVWESKEKTIQTNIDIAKKENKSVSQLESELKTARETKEILAKKLEGLK